MRAFYAPTPVKLEAIKHKTPPKTAQLPGQHFDGDQLHFFTSYLGLDLNPRLESVF